MSNEITTLSEDKIKKALRSLHAARTFERDRLIYGVNRVYQYVKDVDTDWLERWGEAQEEELCISTAD